jgi:hypothetical protein
VNVKLVWGHPRSWVRGRGEVACCGRRGVPLRQCGLVWREQCHVGLKKLTKGEIADLYKQLVAGLVLVTAKEVLAVAPGIRDIRIVALRGTPADPYGRIHPESILAAQIPRSALNGVQWTRVDALSIVNKVSSELLTRTAGPSKAFAPLDLKTEPEIARLIQVIASGR